MRGWGYPAVALYHNTDLSIFEKLLRPSHKRPICLRCQIIPKTQMPLSSAPSNPLNSCIRSIFAGQLKKQRFFYHLAPLLENKLKHKRAAPHHMYLDSPFHSNQAAAKERTYRETDGPALNTRRNSLEGLRDREGDGMNKLQINATIEFSLIFIAEPSCKYCYTYYSH